MAGHQLTGLLQSSLQVLPGQETGGPLVNLSGQVVGIDVGGAGSGLHAKGFAIPVNRALAVARELHAGGALTGQFAFRKGGSRWPPWAGYPAQGGRDLGGSLRKGLSPAT